MTGRAGIIIRDVKRKRLHYVAMMLVLLMVVVSIMSLPGCREHRHDITVKNELEQPVTIWISDSHDPTNRLYERNAASTAYLCSKTTIKPGSEAVFSDEIWLSHPYYIIEAKAGTDCDEEAQTLFICKFTVDELESLDWEIAVDAGYEQPSWSVLPSSLTLMNELNHEVRAILRTTDDSEDTKGVPEFSWLIKPGENVRGDDVIREENLFYIIISESREDTDSGQVLFIQRYTREDFEALDWTVVLEPGHEEPDW